LLQEIRAVSFDHLVGAGGHRFWDGDISRLRSLEIYNQIQADGLLERNLSRVAPLKMRSTKWAARLELSVGS
jgi:hypothetical protein